MKVVLKEKEKMYLQKIDLEYLKEVEEYPFFACYFDACKELNLTYYGWDLNKELVDWHISKERVITENNKCGISYGDAIYIKNDSSNCSVFICPPYTDTEVYFEGQDINKTQCDWLKVCINNIPNAKEYVMVCKVVDSGFEKYIVDEKINKSHFGINKEYVIKLNNEQAREIIKEDI